MGMFNYLADNHQKDPSPAGPLQLQSPLLILPLRFQRKIFTLGLISLQAHHNAKGKLKVNVTEMRDSIFRFSQVDPISVFRPIMWSIPRFPVQRFESTRPHRRLLRIRNVLLS